MRCPRCHSENLIQIGHLIYCRNCISFGQIRPNDKSQSIAVGFGKKKVYYALDYELSPMQKAIANDVVEALKQKKHVVIEAVCGSGKTELVYPSIVSYLSQGKTVGFSLPRKDLTIEIYTRLSKQVKGVQMTLVYGGHHEDCYCPLVVCTTHQLHRYWHFFDLLIIDEVDAFPFAHNELLSSMALSACRGQMILMSATAFESISIPENFCRYSLNRRYHGHDLPVPRLIWCPDVCFIALTYFKIKRLMVNHALCLVFVPVRKDAIRLKKQFEYCGLKADYVDACKSDIQEVLEQFRLHKIQLLISTTLLERGVTFENVHVFVYRAHHRIFDQATLTQIAGRVGRKPNYPDGQVYFVGRRITHAMRQCQKAIRKKNNV